MSFVDNPRRGRRGRQATLQQCPSLKTPSGQQAATATTLFSSVHVHKISLSLRLCVVAALLYKQAKTRHASSPAKRGRRQLAPHLLLQGHAKRPRRYVSAQLAAHASKPILSAGVLAAIQAPKTGPEQPAVSFSCRPARAPAPRACRRRWPRRRMRRPGRRRARACPCCAAPSSAACTRGGAAAGGLHTGKCIHYRVRVAFSPSLRLEVTWLARLLRIGPGQKEKHGKCMCSLPITSAQGTAGCQHTKRTTQC